MWHMMSCEKVEKALSRSALAREQSSWSSSAAASRSGIASCARRASGCRSASEEMLSERSGTARLWRSEESRERWHAAMGAARSHHVIAVGLVSLREHLALFLPALLGRPIASARRVEAERNRLDFYHAKW